MRAWFRLFALVDRLAPPARGPRDDISWQTIARGALGGYINNIYFVDAESSPRMAAAILKIRDQAGYDAFAKEFSVDRRSPDFWSKYDAVMDAYMAHAGAEAGEFDLSRYRM